MKITYITGDDPHSLSGWSGLTYFIGDALKNAGNDLSYINSFTLRSSAILKLKQKIYPKLSGKFVQPNRYPFVINQYSEQISSKLALLEKPDILFSNSSEMIAATKENIPKAFWVDASFAGMIGYYPEFSILHPETIKKANQLEQKAYDKASLIFFASDWAAETARSNYRIDEKKINVVPFGANLLRYPYEEEILKYAKHKSENTCDLLFIGVYWERKGGPLAVKVTEELIKQGINATLTIVGCSPFNTGNKPDYVRQMGFLSKENSSQKDILEKLFIQSHFLIIPTTAECFGLVFCEANAYGLPVIATNTGGIPTIVRDNINGKLFNSNDHAVVYCNYIKEYFLDCDKYRNLSERSYHEFKTRLNWKVSGALVSRKLHEIQ